MVFRPKNTVISKIKSSLSIDYYYFRPEVKVQTGGHFLTFFRGYPVRPLRSYRTKATTDYAQYRHCQHLIRAVQQHGVEKDKPPVPGQFASDPEWMPFQTMTNLLFVKGEIVLIDKKQNIKKKRNQMLKIFQK